MGRRLLYIIILILLPRGLSSQEIPVYSQYIYNKFLINPAVAGSDGYTSLNLTGREQWVGYKGAPRTYSFSAQTRILKKSIASKQARRRKGILRPGTDGKIGLGGYVFSDKNGLIQKTGFQFSYAYHMWLRNSTQFSMGLALTGYNYRINESEIDFENPNEPWMNNNLRRGIFVPDATFGAYLLNARYSFGFSADQLFEASARITGNAYKDFRTDRHYYIFGSYDLKPDVHVTIQPNFLFITGEQLQPEVNIGTTYIYENDFWIGISYRSTRAIIANVGWRYEKFYFGYSFDFTLQEIQRVTYGTHEITLALKLGDSRRRYRWLERY